MALLNHLVSCTPIASQWNVNIEFKCVDEIKLFTAALVTDVITDGGSPARMELCKGS